MDLDGTKSVRAGEELPLERLAQYLRQQWPGPEEKLSVEQFPEGYSNLTYSVRHGAQEFVLRRPPYGNEVKAAHDMSREFLVLSRLCKVYPAAPKPLLFCEDESVLGAPFYLMERRRGIVIRKQAPPELESNPAAVRKLCQSLIDQLVDLHSLDYQAIGLGELGRPAGFIERQVAGWTKRFQKAQTSDVPEMTRAAEWLAAHQPGESGAALIHNDFKYDNLLLDPNDLTRIIAVFDWEMATIGDPFMDLGVALSYWVESGDPELMKQAAFGPTALPGSMTRKELVARYEEKCGRRFEPAHFYYSYGLFKLAVIVQQIYARFVRGHTQDPRFAHLDRVVQALAVRAMQAIEAGSL
jgi:aminoglycoside phosphotransferase (APT) family kinase protein